MKFILLALVFIFGVVSSKAALPDSVVQENMKRSPEILEIFVLRTDSFPNKKNPNIKDVEVFAQVMGVNKTTSNISSGSKIRIVFGAPNSGSFPAPGTFAVFVPKVGQQLTAYLTQGQPANVYEPTPGTYGFEPKSP